jgi:hypothetical protein
MTTRKPMAAAIRAFVAGMNFPPAPEHGPSPNKELAALVVTMLQFAKDIPDHSDVICVDPALSQVAEVLHCSARSIKRGLRTLREMKLLTERERGRISTAYTFYQNPAGTTVDPARNSSGDNSPSQRGQLKGVAGTTRPPAGTTVVHLWSKATGSSLENKPLEGLAGSVSVSQLDAHDLRAASLKARIAKGARP